MEQMRQRQQHKMAALLSRVTAVCQHDPSTSEKDCQHDPAILEKERQHNPTPSQKQCQQDPSTVKKEHRHHLTIEKECSGVDKEPNTNGQTTVKKKQQPVHSATVRKRDATIGLITSKLVRQELVSIIVT